MVTIHVKNIEGKTVLPVHADGKPSSRAAGYDIIAVDDPIVVGVVGAEQEIEGNKILLYSSIDYLEYHTALHFSPQFNEDGSYNHTLAHPRSSTRKYNLLLANSIGLLDNDYRGEILISYKYIWQPEDFVLTSEGRLVAGINWTKIYRKGDKIAQLVSEKTNPMEFVLVSELDATVRGEGGHGSTDTIAITRKGLPLPTEKDIRKLDEEHRGAYGTIVERYQKAGGIPVKKKYSDEIKARDSQ